MRIFKIYFRDSFPEEVPFQLKAGIYENKINSTLDKLGK